MSGKKVYAGGLRIGTRCETIDEFIEIFHRFCDGSLIFIPQAKRQVGIDAAFSFDLKDGRTALCGVGVVLEQFTDADNRFGRPGVVIELRQLQDSSRPVFEQMSAMQRARRGTSREVRPTAPPPMGETTPVSPRKLTPIPSYRPRAITSAIEIDSAMAFAKETAAAKSGGLSKRTLPSMPIAVPKLIPTVPRGNAPPPEEPPVQAASAMHVDAAPDDEPTQPPPLPAAPQLAQASGALVDHAAPVLADASDSRQETAAPQEAVAQSAVGLVDRPEAPVEAPGVAANIAEPPSLGRRLGEAARKLAREAQTGSRRVASTLSQRWRALTPRQRWLVGGGAAAPVAALAIVLVIAASKSPAPQPTPSSQGSANTTGSAAEVVAPTVEPAPKKKPTVKKKKRVAIKKRVASKTVAKPAAKKPVAKKPAAKPTAVKKPATKPTAGKKPTTKPTAKKPAPEPTR